MTYSKRNDGVDFEKLVERLLAAIDSNPGYTRAEHDVKIEGPDGERQVDVLIESEVAGQPVTTLVECKDWNKRVDIKAIDAFHSKMLDLNANLGILASRFGFSKAATSKAKRLGIRLLTVDEAPTVMAKLGLQLPICLIEISPKRLMIKASLRAAGDEAGEKLSMDAVSGVNLAEYVTRAVGRDQHPTTGLHDLVPDDLRPWTVETYNPDRPEYKRTRELENLELRYHIDVKCWFGPMDLSGEAAHAVHDLSRGQVTVVFESGEQESQQELLYRIGASQIDHLGRVDNLDAALEQTVGDELPVLCLVHDFRNLAGFKGAARNLGPDGEWTPGDFSLVDQL